MPQFRKLHTKIIDSYDFAEMPNDFTRVFWMLLIVTLDSEGRAINNPAWLRSRMFPLRDDVTNKAIDGALDWLDTRSMVVRYQVNGRKYFHVPNFKKYQTGTEKEAKSVLPAPITTLEEVKSLSGEGQELVSVAASASVIASASEYVSVSELQEEPDEFELLRLAIQDNAHITPSSQADIKAITEMIAAKVTPLDIPGAVQWLVDNGKVIRYASSLVGPAKTQALMRMQPAKSNGNGNGNKKIIRYGPDGEAKEFDY